MDLQLFNKYGTINNRERGNLMFNIENNTLYKYTGNDKVVTIPDNVEVINTNAFEDNENIEVIIGNNVKRLCYNAINLCCICCWNVHSVNYSLQCESNFIHN
jgi:hypothetical protein